MDRTTFRQLHRAIRKGNFAAVTHKGWVNLGPTYAFTATQLRGEVSYRTQLRGTDRTRASRALLLTSGHKGDVETRRKVLEIVRDFFPL